MPLLDSNIATPYKSTPSVSVKNKSGTMIYTVEFFHAHQNKEHNMSIVLNRVLDDYGSFLKILKSFEHEMKTFKGSLTHYEMIKYVLNEYPDFTGTFVSTWFRIPFTDGKLHTSPGKQCIFYDSMKHPTAHFNIYMGHFDMSPDPAIWYKGKYHLYTSAQVPVSIDDLFNGGKNICHKFYNNENPMIEPHANASWHCDKPLISFGESDSMYWSKKFYDWCKTEQISIDKTSFLTYILTCDPKSYSKQEIISDVFFVQPIHR